MKNAADAGSREGEKERSQLWDHWGHSDMAPSLPASCSEPRRLPRPTGTVPASAAYSSMPSSFKPKYIFNFISQLFPPNFSLL